MPRPNDSERTPLDDLLDVLSHPYRRRVLALVRDRNPRDESEFSAEELEVDPEEADFLPLELHHRHLPKLAEAGFVDWNHEENVVRRGPRFDEVEPLIELMADHADELPEGWP